MDKRVKETALVGKVVGADIIDAAVPVYDHEGVNECW